MISCIESVKSFLQEGKLLCNVGELNILFHKIHPNCLIDFSSMASIPPPDVWYKLSLPSEVAERSFLSALQLEAVIYACQQHEKLLPNGKRAGFLIGK